jgi:hypothetical protein
VVIATGGTLKTTLYVYLKTTGTPASEITITGTALTGADLTAAGAALGNGVTVTPKTDRFVITGLTAADSTGGVTTLLTGTDKVKVTLKADAQQSGASGVAAHTGVPVVVLEDSAGGYTVVAAASGVGANLAKLHYDSTSKVLKYNETTTNAETTETLDEDFDAALIAVLSNLVPTDTVEFDANGNANAVVFTIAPTAAAKLQAVLDNVGGTTPGVTLGGSTQTTTIAAGSTVTIPAGVTVTVDAANILSVAGTLAFTDNTSVLALIGADGELKATADTAKFHANATTTTGAGLSLTVTAAADLTTATGWSSDNPGTGVSVTVTTGTAASGSGAAYVLGNASLAIKNVTTGAIHAVIPEVSTAAGTATEGGIKAGASSAVVITGKASA